MKIEDWKPEIVEERDDGPVYITVLCEGKRCASCSRVMLPHSFPPENVQPKYHRVALREQLRRADVRLVSSSRKNGQAICDACERAGLGSFTCSLCKQERQGEPQKEWEDDALCRRCYETAPAKQWDEICRELEEKHRYDFC